MARLTGAQKKALVELCADWCAGGSRHSRTFLRQKALDAGIPASYSQIEAACRKGGVKWVDLNSEDLLSYHSGYRRADKWRYDDIFASHATPIQIGKIFPRDILKQVMNRKGLQ